MLLLDLYDALRPLDTLTGALQALLGDQIKSLSTALGEVTIELGAADYLPAAQLLRDDASTRFEQLIDLCPLRDGTDIRLRSPLPLTAER